MNAKTIRVIWTISAPCLSAECDADLVGIEGDYDIFTDIMTYSCPKCGYENNHDNWRGM